MPITLNGTTGITSDTGFAADGVSFADNAPANTLVTTSAGNVGVGTSSPLGRMQVRAASPQIFMEDSAAGLNGKFTAIGTNNGNMTFSRYLDSGALVGEFARSDASGNLLVGTTSALNGSSIFKTPNGLDVYRTTAVAGNAIQYWYSDNTATASLRAYIAANGGLYNFQANNSNLSDARVKSDIQNSGGYLEKICAIPVRTFKYIDQSDDLVNLGVIAQEVEAVAPELVNSEGWGESVPDDGVPLKSIYQTDLQYALMKCIQEQQAIIQSLTQRIAALEGASDANTGVPA